MKRIRIVLCCLIFIYLLTGCKDNRENEIEGTGIYYLNTEGTGLVKEEYKLDGETTEEQIDAILAEMQKETECIDYTSPFPTEVELEKWIQYGNKIDLYFNVKYNNMDATAEVLLRAALVQTLTQIEEVEYVSFFVAGHPILDNSGQEVGYQSAEDYIQNIGSTLHSYQKGEITLYFADLEGRMLKSEEINVRYNSNMSMEKLVVEELMKGPSTSECQATFAKDTKVLGVSVKNGVCYVNFDESFLTNQLAVDPKLTIYSLVNSIIKNGNVTKVQILVNGETNVKYQESIDLSHSFSKDFEIVEEE